MEGLAKVEKLKPGGGYAELLAGARGVGTAVEGYARGELGWHLLPNAALFSFGEASVRSGSPVGWQAGLGGRVSW